MTKHLNDQKLKPPLRQPHTQPTPPHQSYPKQIHFNDCNGVQIPYVNTFPSVRRMNVAASIFCFRNNCTFPPSNHNESNQIQNRLVYVAMTTVAFSFMWWQWLHCVFSQLTQAFLLIQAFKFKGIFRDHSRDNAHQIQDFCILVMVLDV